MNRLQHRRSLVTGAPLVAQLLEGEIALNLADKDMYFSTGSEVVQMNHLKNAKGDATHRSVTDAQIAAWSSNQASLGYSPVDRAGDTMTGELVLSGAPTLSGAAATKGYVDAAVSAISGSYGPPVQALLDLAAVDSAALADKQLVLVEDVAAIYHYDAQSTIESNGLTIISPLDLTLPESAGRWIKIQAATQDHEALVGLLGGAASDHQHLTSAQHAEALAERGLRELADASVVALLGKETDARVLADTAHTDSLLILTGLVGDEETARVAAQQVEHDARLLADSTESSTRYDADALLRTDLDLEISARIGGDSYIMSEISSTELGKGAALVGLNDPTNLLVATNVEAAIVELATSIADKAIVASTSLAGEVTARTEANLLIQTSVTDLQTTVYTKTEVDAKIELLVGAAPAVLDTLVELSAALGGDENFATTVATALTDKASVASMAAETEARVLAVATVTSAVEAEATARALAVTGVTDSAAVETNARIAADNILQDNIVNAIEARGAALLEHATNAVLHMTLDQNAFMDALTVSVAEVNQLTGVTSHVQSQLNGKENALGYTPVSRAGDTMEGPLALVADPLSAMQAATKQYVDKQVSKLLPISLSVLGKPVAGAVVVAVAVVSAGASLSANKCLASSGTASAASAVMNLCRNGVVFGTATFAAASSTAVFQIASTVAFVAGDLITVTSPTVQDSALRDIAFHFSLVTA